MDGLLCLHVSSQLLMSAWSNSLLCNMWCNKKGVYCFITFIITRHSFWLQSHYVVIEFSFCHWLLQARASYHHLHWQRCWENKVKLIEQHSVLCILIIGFIILIFWRELFHRIMHASQVLIVYANWITSVS